MSMTERLSLIKQLCQKHGLVKDARSVFKMRVSQIQAMRQEDAELEETFVEAYSYVDETQAVDKEELELAL